MADSAEVKDMKRYDRQIRLWGLETQRGLQSARLLMLGVNGLTNEVAKNLVLTGVAHVTLQDESVLTAEDVSNGALFSVSTEKLGAGRAELLAEQLKEMNPLVHFETCRKPVTSLSADFLRGFHFIIGTSNGVGAIRDVCTCTDIVEGDATRELKDESPPTKRQRADGERGRPRANSNGAHMVVPMRAVAREDSPPAPRFIAAGCFGLHGYCFFDHGAPIARIPLPPQQPNDDAKVPAVASAPKAPKVERALYPTIATASQVEWSALSPRVPRLYHALQLLLEPHASRPNAVTEEVTRLLPAGAPVAVVERLQAMLTRRAGILEGDDAAAKWAQTVTHEFVAEIAQGIGHELAPVCAVMGGMIANEVIKLISGADRPINNALFFDGRSCDGVVQRLGPSFDCPSGLDSGAWVPVEPSSS